MASSIIDILDAFENEPPAIDYVLPGMIAGTVGALVSPGGAGKSMLALQFGVALQIGATIAGGPDLLGLGDFPCGRTLYLAAEDPQIAIRWRLHHMGKHLPPEQRYTIPEGLVIQSLIGKNPDICDPRWFDAFRRGADGTRLMIFDTLRRFHHREENDSGQMAEVVGLMEQIADESGCSILFLHHAAKAAVLGGQGDQQQASRGSSVLVDNIRWSSFLAGMTKAEAADYGVDEAMRGYWVRFGIPKQNYGPPCLDRWLRRLDGGILQFQALEKQPKGSGERRVKDGF